MSRLLLGIFSSILAVFLFISPAGAAVFSISSAITVDLNPFTAAQLTLNPVADVDIPANQATVVCLSGTCANDGFTSADWILFTATVTEGEIDEFNMSLLTGTLVGYGYYNNGPSDGLTYGTGPQNSWNIDNSSGDNTLFSDTGPTTTTKTLFAQYTLGTLSTAETCNPVPYPPFEICGWGEVQFMVSSSGISWSEIQTIAPIPEPSTGLLVGLGCIGLGVHGRRRRNS